jgi:hypothetical protein
MAKANRSTRSKTATPEKAAGSLAGWQTNAVYGVISQLALIQGSIHRMAADPPLLGDHSALVDVFVTIEHLSKLSAYRLDQVLRSMEAPVISGFDEDFALDALTHAGTQEGGGDE